MVAAHTRSQWGKAQKVTWQDDLQHLDAELAAGRISAEEYRARRDALGRAQQNQSPPGGVPQPQQNPFPPAFSWHDAAKQGEANAAEPTQVVRRQDMPQPPAGTGYPQATSPSAGPAEQHDAGQGQTEGHTQQFGVTPPPQQGWNDQGGWGANWGGQANVGTPWGEPDPPEHGESSWMRQGPEVFDSAAKPSRGKLIAGIAIPAVLAVALIIAAVFYWVLPSGEPQAGGGSETASTTAQPTSEPLPEPPAAKPNPPANPKDVLIPPPPGPQHAFNGPLQAAELNQRKQGLLRPDVREFALRNGMRGGWFHGTNGPPQVTLLAVRMPDERVASQLTERYLEDQEGLTVDEDLSYRGVRVYSTGGGTLRTAYTSHEWAVIVAVHDPSDSAAKATPLFKDLLEQQLGAAPPTVRK